MMDNIRLIKMEICNVFNVEILVKHVLKLIQMIKPHINV